MKKYLVILIILIVTVLSVGCSSSSNGEQEEKIILSSTEYTDELDMNSPEGLAKESSSIYQKMISEEITTDEGFERLLAITCEQSVEALKGYQEEFADQIGETIQYFNANEDAILEFKYAETEYTGEDKASIKRIQIQKNGGKYYFRQDFILENDVWKIQGDNVINDFEIEKKFLFWTI